MQEFEFRWPSCSRPSTKRDRPSETWWKTSVGEKRVILRLTATCSISLSNASRPRGLAKLEFVHQGDHFCLYVRLLNVNSPEDRKTDRSARFWSKTSIRTTGLSFLTLWVSTFRRHIYRRKCAPRRGESKSVGRFRIGLILSEIDRVMEKSLKFCAVLSLPIVGPILFGS
jgi:hypothetical protein